MTDLNSLKIGDLICPKEEYRFSSVVKNGNKENILFRNLTFFPGVKVSYIDKDYILVKKMEPSWSEDIIVLNKSAKQ